MVPSASQPKMSNSLKAPSTQADTSGTHDDGSSHCVTTPSAASSARPTKFDTHLAPGWAVQNHSTMPSCRPEGGLFAQVVPQEPGIVCSRAVHQAANNVRQLSKHGKCLLPTRSFWSFTRQFGGHTHRSSKAQTTTPRRRLSGTVKVVLFELVQPETTLPGAQTATVRST